MTETSNRIAFLTGATGFIGSRVAEELCKHEWNVRALVRNISKAHASLEHWQSDTPRKIEFVEGDLFAGSPSERMQLFMGCMKNASVVFHLAEAKTREKNSDARLPKRSGGQAKNIKALGLLLEAARATPSLQRFVFVSAFMAGGLPQPLPQVLTEEMTGVEFPDPYYQWKKMAERLLIKSAGTSHFNYSIIRPALVYGPNAEWLTTMLKLIRTAGKYFIPLPEGGRALLGTIHVEDAANTIAMSGSSEHARNQIIHAIDDGGTTYRDWFDTIARAAKWKVNVSKIPRGLVYSFAKAADAVTSVAGIHFGAHLWAQVLSDGCGYSNEKMKKIIGSLSYPTIREGIPGMMRWFNNSHQ